MSEEKNKPGKNDNIPFLIPSGAPTIYATGAFGGYTPHDFRIFLYSEAPHQQDEILPPGKIAVMREIQSELVMSPLAAKELAHWLLEKVKGFEKDFGSIPAPKEESGEKGKNKS